MDIYNGPVWDALMEQCEKGNVTAIKLYFELMEKREKIFAENDEEDEKIIIIEDV